MPVRKFRSAADLPRPSAVPLDPRNLDRALALSALCAALAGRRLPPGVYRHRSADEAYRQRRAWQVAQARLRAERKADDPSET